MEGKPLSHGRDLTQFLNRYGVTDPRRMDALELAPEVQMVVPIDDARHLVSPLGVPAAHYHCYEGAAGAGIYSSVVITALSSGGIYLTFAFVIAGSAVIRTEGVPAFTPTGAAETPDLVVGNATPSSIVQTGTIPASPGGITFGNNYVYPGCPFWVPSGAQILIFNAAANTAFNLAVGLQEVP